MDYLVIELFDKKTALSLRNSIYEDKDNWIDGKSTAGGHAKKVKNNFQLKTDSKTYIDVTNKVVSTLNNNSVFKRYSIPKKIHSTLLSRAVVNQGYGMHWDNAYMNGGNRCDLAFTLFLEDPNNYEGGQLYLETMPQARTVKLDPGQVIIYPCKTLHQVNKVTKGERIVCVGWIHSFVQDHEKRNTLFTIDSSIQSLLKHNELTDEFKNLYQCYNNLLRMFGE